MVVLCSHYKPRWSTWCVWTLHTCNTTSPVWCMWLPFDAAEVNVVSHLSFLLICDLSYFSLPLYQILQGPPRSCGPHKWQPHGWRKGMEWLSAQILCTLHVCIFPSCCWRVWHAPNPSLKTSHIAPSFRSDTLPLSCHLSLPPCLSLWT